MDFFRHSDFVIRHCRSDPVFSVTQPKRLTVDKWKGHDWDHRDWKIPAGEDFSVNGGFDRRKSLQDLEQQDWVEPNYDSYLVTTCHQLRRKPLKDFTAEDLRIMIEQGLSLSYLIPLAVERLAEEPLIEGDFYPGDLLSAVVRTEKSFWDSHPDSFQRMRQIVRRVKEALPSLDEAEFGPVRKAIEEWPHF